jgi:hypothetical protein
MAYFIFLKYLDSLEDFRKNLHVKSPPKSPPTNFQSLGIFKNPIFIWKKILSTFGPIGSAASRPIRPFSPHGPASRLLPPPAWEQCVQAATAGRPHAAPMVGPDYVHRRENNGRITPSFPPLSSALPPLQSPVFGAFNPGALKLLQHRLLKAPGLPRLASTL